MQGVSFEKDNSDTQAGIASAELGKVTDGKEQARPPRPMRVKNVETFGPVDSENFRKIINMPGLTRKNWFLNRDANLYYFYYQKENKRTVIVMEPSAEMVETLRKYLPHGVYHVPFTLSFGCNPVSNSIEMITGYCG